MTDGIDADAPEAAELLQAREQLMQLARVLGRAGAEAAYRLGLEFDLDNPEVARDLMLATFQGVLISKCSERRRRRAKVPEAS